MAMLSVCGTMVVLKNVFACLKGLNEHLLTAFVAGITSMSFNRVMTSISSNFCAADRLLAYVVPGDVCLLVREDDCLCTHGWPPFLLRFELIM